MKKIRTLSKIPGRSYNLFRGDPRYFCHLAFPIIDTDHNGFISFIEFMSVVFLALPGNMWKKVELVCF